MAAMESNQPVKMTRIDSSTVAAVGYDSGDRCLYVRFTEGRGTYVYYDVPTMLFEELLAAESKGRFLNERLKGSYRYQKV